MNVQVIFQGLMLWWMLGAQPAMLIPNFANDPTAPHHATMLARPEAFVATGCPAPFVFDAGTGLCGFVLDGAGASGGVRLSFSGTGANQFGLSQFCALPPIVSSLQLTLIPEFTPPSTDAPNTGSSLTAWMPMIGGAAGSFAQPCVSMPDCPRAVVWSVPGSVVLHMDNLAGGGAVSLPLTPGAIITIRNQPSDALVASRAKHARKRNVKGKAAHAMTGSPSDTYDWCLYYKMFQAAGAPVPCVPPQLPLNVSCGIAPPTQPSSNHDAHLIGTIACSNSQYP